MTDKEILDKAIEKALKNGFNWSIKPIFDSTSRIMGKNTYNRYFILGVIQSHQFAKAFWGEKEFCFACERHHEQSSDCDAGFGSNGKEWEIRLRQMVLEENPIKYLEQFL